MTMTMDARSALTGDALTALVVDPNPDSRLDTLAAARAAQLHVIGEAAYGAEATFLAADRSPSVILLALEEPPMRGLATLEALQRQAPETPVIVYSSVADPRFLREAMRAGARDFLAKPLRGSDLEDAASTLTRRLASGPDRGIEASSVAGTGTIITVAGAKGGIGKSTLAANLSLALRELTEQEVALLDADVQFGDVGVMLDMEPSPEQCVAYLARDEVQVTRQVVANCLLKHSSGVDLLGVFPEPEDWRAVRPEQLARIARALTETHEYVVLDTPGTINELVATALMEADIVLLVTSLEMSSIKDTKTATRILGSLGVESGRVRLVINDSTQASSVTPQDVAEATGVQIAATVPHDRRMGRSVQRGVPVLQDDPSGAFSRAVKDLAGAIAGVTAQTSSRRRLPFRLQRGAR